DRRQPLPPSFRRHVPRAPARGDRAADAAIRRMRAAPLRPRPRGLPPGGPRGLQRRDAPRRGGERARRLLAPGDLGALEGAGMAAGRAAPRPVQPSLHGDRRMRRVDALVIGAGPAGATAALVLARGGLSVLLAEKSAFPRRKVCGEYISAASWPLLDEIGAAHLEASAGPPVHAVGFFAGAHVASSPMPLLDGRAGRAVRREILDTELTALARDAGADVHQPASVVSYQRLGGRFEAHLEDEDANAQEIEARVVIAAHGSWERPPHPAAERSVRRNADLLGFKAHFAEARLAKGLMPLVLFPGGYGGLVAVDERHVSFSCCVRRDALRAIRERARGQPAGEALLEHVMRSCRGVREALAPAWRASPWLAAGPIRPGIRPLY